MNCKNTTITLNSRGESVKELQTYLRACEIYTGKLDGYCGPYMVEAIKIIQKKNGNTPDGFWGPKTCAKSDINSAKTFNRSPSVTQNRVDGNIRELLITFKKQPDIVSCGPTSLAMCYSYYGLDYDIYHLKKLCNTNCNGTSPNDLLNAASKVNKNYKLIEEDYHGLKQIIKHINNKNPLIVQLQTIPELGYKGSFGHYAAITGYNKKSKTVKIADPSRTIKWIIEPILRNAIEKRLSLGKIKPIKALKNKRK